MLIDYIYIKGFKSDNNIVEIDFKERDVAIIYGLNGSGKTTLLRVIHAIFDKNEEILVSEKINYIKLRVINNNNIEEEIEIKRISSIDMEDKENYDAFEWEEFDSSSLVETTSILFGVNRGITNRVNINQQNIYSFIANSYRNIFKNPRIARDFSNGLFNYLNEQSMKIDKDVELKDGIRLSDIRNLNIDYINMERIRDIIYKRYRLSKELISSRVQKALFDTLSSAINPEKNGYYQKISTEDFKTGYSTYRELLLESILDTDENQLRNELVVILQENSAEELIDICNKTKNFLLATLLYKMVEQLKSGREILESVNNLEKIFNSHLEDGKQLIINNEEVYVKVGKDKHSLSDLSSGERHLLTFLTLFLIEGNNKDFLLIDEPEISLNINWQREILPLLKKISPNAQIIVASHSPSIAKITPDSLVKMEVSKENE